MVARFLYRLVSLLLFLLAIAAWLVGAGAIALQFIASGTAGLHLALFCVTIVACVMAMAAMTCSGDAWRAARYHHVRYN